MVYQDHTWASSSENYVVKKAVETKLTDGIKSEKKRIKEEDGILIPHI